jgi:hypothetical protein
VTCCAIAGNGPGSEQAVDDAIARIERSLSE